MSSSRQKAKGKRQNFGAGVSILRAVFAVFVFAAFAFAQTAEKTPAENTKDFTPPKVVQIDHTGVAELLKPNGKPLLVNFWATWCIPCREEFPDLVEIDEEFKGKIDFITITLDDPAEIGRDVPNFLAEMKAGMPTYLLYTNQESEVISSVSKDWQGGLPFTVLYNAKGEVVHTKQGKIKPDVVKAEINKLVNPEISDIQILELPITKEIYTYEKGIEEAKKDVADGVYKIKYYGLVPMSSPEYTAELKRKYGIEIIYHGCMVSAGMVEYGKGYNEISIAAIKAKFGEKILE